MRHGFRLVSSEDVVAGAVVTGSGMRLLAWQFAVVLGLVLAVYVHLWATRLFGVEAGWMALVGQALPHEP